MGYLIGQELDTFLMAAAPRVSRTLGLIPSGWIQVSCVFLLEPVDMCSPYEPSFSHDSALACRSRSMLGPCAWLETFELSIFLDAP